MARTVGGTKQWAAVITRVAAFIWTRLKNFRVRYVRTTASVVYQFLFVDCMAFRLLGIRQTVLLWNAVATRSKEELTLTARGIRGSITLRPWKEDYQVFRQVFLQEDYRVKLPSNPNVIIDGGANCGYSSMFLAEHFPSSLVLAIEPETENFECLRRNAAPYENIKTIRAALWPHDAIVEEVSGTSKSWSFQFREKTGSTSSVEDQLEGLSVQTILQRFGLSCVDLVKLDIEGAERELFSEAFEWLAGVRAIFVELHERYAPGATQAVLARAKQFNFRVGQRGEKLIMVKEAL